MSVFSDEEGKTWNSKNIPISISLKKIGLGTVRIYLLCAPVLTPHMTGLPCDPGAVTENWSVSQRVSPLDAVENTYELTGAMEVILNWGVLILYDF